MPFFWISVKNVTFLWSLAFFGGKKNIRWQRKVFLHAFVMAALWRFSDAPNCKPFDDS